MARLLLINPWIHDFAAFDLWVRPLGFLELAAALRAQGHIVDYIDLLQVTAAEAVRWGLKPPKPRQSGMGHFTSTFIPKPDAYAFVPRRYRRFGLPPEGFHDRLKALEPPDVILVTSGMTYWYPGVAAAISVIKSVLPRVPLALGGTYATLCPDHARRVAGADTVLPGPWPAGLPSWLAGRGISLEPRAASMPCAANDLYPGSRVAAMRLTTGCPFACDYCASSALAGPFRARDPGHAVAEIAWNAAAGRTEIALYDDALLFQSERVLVPVLDAVLARRVPCRFHTPNGLHARYVTPEVARLMHRAGFATVRVSFEGVAGRGREASNGKADPGHLEQALNALHGAGYPRGTVEVYTLIGLPGQTEGAIMETAAFINRLGGMIRAAEYASVPGTKLYAEDAARDPRIAAEPLLHNDTVAPGWNFDLARLERVKQAIKALNKTPAL
jgi:hypothetical protein